MMQISLNQDWRVRHEELHVDAGQHAQVALRTEGWLTADLPCDVHQPLIAAGLMSEPLIGENYREALWTEKKSWWFLNQFDVGPGMLLHDVIELTLESLDVEADVYLNGTHLGHQRSAFYPFSRDVKSLLLAEANVLLVRVTSGLERYGDNDLADFPQPSIGWPEEGRADHRRIMVRKPQYTFGWDWGPRVASCGIMGEAWLTGHTAVAIRSTHVVVKRLTPDAEVHVEVECENLNALATLDVEVEVTISFSEQQVLRLTQEVPLRSGLNYVNFTGKILSPRLWWPNGMGAQPLYTVETTVKHARGLACGAPHKLGLRVLRLKQDDLGGGERSFGLEVNGVQVFAKGANWVPADSIYARVTDDRYTQLVSLAQEANFNMLRIWGGGLYERASFYQACDARGILVWHDFMFSCGLYPDRLAWFREEVEREMEYQTRRLRSHPCMALWCGSNENHWGAQEWWTAEKKTQPAYFGGEQCYNHIAPRVVQRNCPEIPYWNSSPYGGEQPNGQEQGDCHYWQPCTMNPDVAKRVVPQEYDKATAKFVSEYGYVGGCPLDSVRRAFGTHPLDRTSSVWRSHVNLFETLNNTVPSGIRRHYAEPDGLSAEDYLELSARVQALMYGYSLEAFRANLRCDGALFWMFNDCWVELGWSIVDYYLQRKVAYHAVRRAFAPVKLILREKDGVVRVTGVNETDQVVEIPVECGYLSFDGKCRDLHPITLTLPARSRRLVYDFALAQHDARSGVHCVLPTGTDGGIIPASLYLHPFRELQRTQPDIHFTCGPISGGTMTCEVSCDTHAHLVHLHLPVGPTASDDYFDLLPGERRIVHIMQAPAGWNGADLVVEAL